jgi:hypothetical protein
MMQRERRVRSKRTTSKVRRYWWLAPVLVIVALILWVATGPEWSRPRSGKTSDLSLPPGYVTSFSTVSQEYQRFYGKPLQDRELNPRFDNATRFMTQHNYIQAAQVLEDISRVAALPAVFNDLGLVYLAQNDRPKAVNAFREALSRDIDYQQVRQNLDRMKEIGFENATPLTHESEPNNGLLSANIIAVGKPVDGEIMAAANDIDCFRAVSPAAPGDTLRIEVTPRSHTMQPVLKVYDSERRLLESINGKDVPGAPIAYTFEPPPNSVFFLEVAGYADSAGLYTVKVTPKKSLDAPEPAR